MQTSVIRFRTCDKRAPRDCDFSQIQDVGLSPIMAPVYKIAVIQLHPKVSDITLFSNYPVAGHGNIHKLLGHTNKYHSGDSSLWMKYLDYHNRLGSLSVFEFARIIDR